MCTARIAITITITIMTTITMMTLLKNPTEDKRNSKRLWAKWDWSQFQASIESPSKEARLYFLTNIVRYQHRWPRCMEIPWNRKLVCNFRKAQYGRTSNWKIWNRPIQTSSECLRRIATKDWRSKQSDFWTKGWRRSRRSLWRGTYPWQH